MATSRLATFLLIGAVSACTSITPVATPTVQPTPTTAPTLAPSAVPTPTPTLPATPAPTLAPTATPAPTPTLAPTFAPTAAPTATPQPQTGLGWTAVDLPPTGDACCWQITSADAGFLLFTGNTDGAPSLMTSTNGSIWRSIDNIVWPGGTVGRIGEWDGSFLAAGPIADVLNPPRLGIWQSPDGRTWFRLADLALPNAAQTADQVMVRTVYATDSHIAVIAEIWPATCNEGCDGPIAVRQFTSIDNGGSWKSTVLDAELANHDPPIQVGDVYVQMNQTGDMIERSTDRKTWQPAWQPPEGEFAQPVEVRTTTAGLVAVGYVGDYEGGLVLSSSDGVTWTQSTGWPDLAGAQTLNDVASFGAHLVAVGARFGASNQPQGYVLVSPPLN